MKKQYICPLLSLTVLEAEEEMLTGSVIGTDVHNDTPADINQDVLTRQYNVWDDEE